jgi:hypothetical protein
MIEMALDAVMLLSVATVAVFLFLITADFALLLKLRSSIPQNPVSDYES